MSGKIHSLRRRLLVRVSVALFILLTIGGLATFGVAKEMGAAVYDRWLLDSAMTLADQLKIRDGKAVLEVPRAAEEMFEWDSVDRIYEDVRSLRAGRLFGNVPFPQVTWPTRYNRPIYLDELIDKRPVRTVAIAVRNPADSTDTILIQVAETRNKRSTLLADTILASMPIQLMLLLAAGLLAWLAVTSSLRTLDELAGRLAGYDPDKLTPLEDVDAAPDEVRPLVKSLNDLIAKLSTAHETQQRFVSNAAHQLRTPLATLQVQTERALREPDPARHGEALGQVLGAVTRLRHVVHQILTLARSDRSLGAESREGMMRVDLAVLAREALERWADAAIARDTDLGYEGPDKGVEILGDPYLLHEMIGNLVDNAIRYGRIGGIVTLSLDTNPPALHVDDDGPGIPPEERALVVERFYRRRSAGGEGCGLGLAIAHEIAQRHGADLHIGESPGWSGTRVSVRFGASSVPLSHAAAGSKPLH